MNTFHIDTPVSPEQVQDLRSGDIVCINGFIYTARDAAHKRLLDMLADNQPLPFDFDRQIVFYAGPSPAKPGRPIGSIGATTSGRMDAYSPELIRRGLKYMIGKGKRGKHVIDEIINQNGMYFTSIGGAAALLSRHVKNSEVIAFDDLGTEAIRKLTVENFPVIVAIDRFGGSIYGN